MTGDDVIRILETLPDDQRSRPVVFEDEDTPNVSWGINEISVHEGGGFIHFRSLVNPTKKNPLRMNVFPLGEGSTERPY